MLMDLKLLSTSKILANKLNSSGGECNEVDFINRLFLNKNKKCSVNSLSFVISFFHELLVYFVTLFRSYRLRNLVILVILVKPDVSAVKNARN